MQRSTYEMIQEMLDEHRWEIDIERGTIQTQRGQVTSTSEKGYLQINTRYKGKNVSVKVHHIIAVAKWGDKVVDMTIDHINGNKTDNSWHNLEIVSIEENTLRAMVSGIGFVAKKADAERESRKVLSPIDVAYIKAKLDANEASMMSLATMFNVNYNRINDIYKGKTYIEVAPLKPVDSVIQTTLF